MGFHKLVNTAQFSYTVRDFKKNGGIYTTAPQGSRDYFAFWEEEDRRCKYGYSVGDLWIPGRHYFHLNFQPMSRVPDSVLIKAIQEREDSKKKVSRTVIDKVMDFPKFWEVHYEWWNLKHIAWYGGEFMGVNSTGNRHTVALKTRGAGFSYMEAADGVYNYNFIPGSKSYYFAGTEPYLVGDAIMDKVQTGLDWINKYSSYWKQNRQVKKNIMHQRASYLDSYGVERGTFSEIIAQVVDKPSKVRGKRGRKAVFEEAGSFPSLEDALEVTLGSLREGSMYVGQASIFGTGGESGPGIQGLENIFYNPEAWDMLPLYNVWEDGMQGTECGYFVPCWRADSFHMDKDGNVDIANAIKADKAIRKKKKKTGRPKDLDRRKAEYPNTPSEALQRLTGNGFNTAEIDAQIKRLITNKSLQGLIRHGKLIQGEAGVEFVMQPKHIARPIEDFPHKQDGNIAGCVSMVQRPYVDLLGKVPEGLYQVTVDSYYKEESNDQTSLWVTRVWKLDNNFDTSFMGLPVAWYVGRPVRYEDNHDITFNLASFFNAKIQGEIAGGGQSIVNYARTRRLLHMLCNEPEMAHNKEIASKSAGNSFLMNMTTERKALGIMYLEDWHVKPRGLDESGNKILNIHRIYDIAFLKELKKFNPKLGNFDRISEAIIAMFMLKENYAIQIQSRIRTEAESFYDRSFYVEEDSSDVSTAY